MRFRTCIALLLLLSACATTEPSPKEPVARNPRRANLQRAAALPWRDEGRCVVQEASHPWPVVVERCFHALDARRIRFRDTERRCPVASADAASVETLVGICLLSQPELAAGAVIIVGTVVVAAAIADELHEYARHRRAHPEDGSSQEDVKPATEAEPSTQGPSANQRPQPEPSPSGQDWLPPAPPVAPPRERRPECIPQPVPHLGGDALHNQCADRVPQNGFPGSDVLVSGKRFDALQLRARVLWEVKTDNFDTYPRALRDIVVRKQVAELKRERDLAAACGFNFRVGVLSAAHKAALELADPDLDKVIIVMDWC